MLREWTWIYEALSVYVTTCTMYPHHPSKQSRHHDTHKNTVSTKNKVKKASLDFKWIKLVKNGSLCGRSSVFSPCSIWTRYNDSIYFIVRIKLPQFAVLLTELHGFTFETIDVKAIL